MPSRKILALVALLFVATLLWRLPAGWAIRLLPDSVRCESARGTAWSGGCARLVVAGTTFQNLRWQLQLRQWWRGHVGALVQLNDTQVAASAQLDYSLGNRLQGRDLKATLRVPSTLVRGLPANFQGQLQLDLPSFEISDGQPVSVQGSLQLQELVQQQPHLELGSYELQLAENSWQNGRLNGTLRDLGGPLRLTGTVTLSVRGEYEVNARVRASRRAGLEFAQLVEALGPADAEGMRPISVAGTF